MLWAIIEGAKKDSPEGMTSQDIRSMSEDDLLDMDYFLNDDELDDDFGEKGFYPFYYNIFMINIPYSQ